MSAKSLLLSPKARRLEYQSHSPKAKPEDHGRFQEYLIEGQIHLGDGRSLVFAGLSKHGQDDDGRPKINQDRCCHCTWHHTFTKDGLLGWNKKEQTREFQLLGHGPNGALCAEYAKKEMPKALALSMNELSFNASIEETCSIFENSIQKVCTRLIENEEMARDSGTTATLFLVDSGDERAYTINLGDSRTVLELEQYGIQATRDHNLADEEEIARIRARGTTALRTWDQTQYFLDPEHPNRSKKDKEYPRRIANESYRAYYKGKSYPGMDFSRSCGDGDAERILGISSAPEARCYDTKTINSVVLATDGIFEFMGNQEVIDIAKNRYHKSLQDACRVAVSTAAERWKADGNVLDDEDSADEDSEDSLKNYIDDSTLVIAANVQGDSPEGATKAVSFASPSAETKAMFGSTKKSIFKNPPNIVDAEVIGPSNSNRTGKTPVAKSVTELDARTKSSAVTMPEGDKKTRQGFFEKEYRFLEAFLSGQPVEEYLMNPVHAKAKYELLAVRVVDGNDDEDDDDMEDLDVEMVVVDKQRGRPLVPRKSPTENGDTLNAMLLALETQQGNISKVELLGAQEDGEFNQHQLKAAVGKLFCLKATEAVNVFYKLKCERPEEIERLKKLEVPQLYHFAVSQWRTRLDEERKRNESSLESPAASKKKDDTIDFLVRTQAKEGEAWREQSDQWRKQGDRWQKIIHGRDKDARKKDKDLRKALKTQELSARALAKMAGVNLSIDDSSDDDSTDHDLSGIDSSGDESPKKEKKRGQKKAVAAMESDEEGSSETATSSADSKSNKKLAKTSVSAFQPKKPVSTSQPAKSAEKPVSASQPTKSAKKTATASQPAKSTEKTATVSQPTKSAKKTALHTKSATSTSQPKGKTFINKDAEIAADWAAKTTKAAKPKAALTTDDFEPDLAEEAPEPEVQTVFHSLQEQFEGLHRQNHNSFVAGKTAGQAIPRNHDLLKLLKSIEVQHPYGMPRCPEYKSYDEEDLHGEPAIGHVVRYKYKSGWNFGMIVAKKGGYWIVLHKDGSTSEKGKQKSSLQVLTASFAHYEK